MLSRMTPKLFTWGEGETEELSMVREMVLTFASVDLVPRRSIPVLLQFNLRKFEVNQVFILERQSVREGGGSEELGLLER